jgi:FixJ family two-component response regulator
MTPLISIIDDDESIQAATRGLVRSLGLRAYTFASAEDFLQSRCVEETSCVITDVKMPGMSGIELQSLLIAQARGMPVVFITAFPNEGIRAQVLASGAIGYLSKPLDGDTLVQCLTAAFKKNDEETVAGSNARGRPAAWATRIAMSGPFSGLIRPRKAR